MAHRTFLRVLILACIPLAIFGFALAAQTQTPDLSRVKPDLVVSGQVSRGESFERDIGHGLRFRLVPSPAGFGNGWDIQIVPSENPSNAPADFAAIVTPPYHFYNARYLNASYGVTARQAVAMSPRIFYFSETQEEFDAASEVVNSVIYSVEWPAKRESLAAAAAKVPLGMGELRILRSRITAGKNSEDLGSIDWVKFEVRFRFHPNLTLQQILFSADSTRQPALH
jgi:hypothetical protein